MRYIDEDDILEKMKEEIVTMIKDLKSTSEEAKEKGWCLEAELEVAIMRIEKTITVINYYKEQL